MGRPPFNYHPSSLPLFCLITWGTPFTKPSLGSRMKEWVEQEGSIRPLPSNPRAQTGHWKLRGASLSDLLASFKGITGAYKHMVLEP